MNPRSFTSKTRHASAGLVAVSAIAIMFVITSPSIAGDPLKDLLGEAQRSQQKAVEDLIGKLEGKPKAPAPEPAVAPPPAPAETATTTPPAPPNPADGTAPAAPVERAERKPEEAPRSGTTIAAPTPPAAGPSPETPTPTAPIAAAPPAPPAAEPSPPSPPTAVTPKAAALETPPPPAAPVVEEAALPSVELDVYFDFNSAAITAKAAETLAPLGRALNDPRLSRSIFLIAGHTDAKGSPTINQQLSIMRAEAVRQYLVTTFGITPSRLIARGFGQTRLKDRDNPLGDTNRRVQIVNVTAYAKG